MKSSKTEEIRIVIHLTVQCEELDNYIQARTFNHAVCQTHEDHAHFIHDEESITVKNIRQ